MAILAKIPPDRSLIKASLFFSNNVGKDMDTQCKQENQRTNNNPPRLWAARVVEISYLGSSQLSSKAARKRRFLAVVGNGWAHCQRGTCKEGQRDEASMAKFPRRNISRSRRVLPPGRADLRVIPSSYVALQELPHELPYPE
ncbi:hypothetical protein EMCG_08609 [[Emmonsia] crescens]|uniref:Uncharacterized protein n=1 Tax=[Emmonsia] crescens TaxID=73230 RepID=A0A0G2JAD4_9EURO|nr:hypothetical protein EMCG_08609 [Emmonsia crescens UAMH 3008]